MRIGFSTVRHRWQQVWAWIGRGARLMVGVPDYEGYVRRQRERFPDGPVLSYAAFIQDRQEARYGRRDGCVRRCC
ncbi:MAG: putative selenoprotein [Magnetococcales bacterium]|nr:putative selenoprotein [Magnetococcales bacterium]